MTNEPGLVSRIQLQGVGVRLEPIVPGLFNWPREEEIQMIIVKTAMNRWKLWGLMERGCFWHVWELFLF